MDRSLHIKFTLTTVIQQYLFFCNNVQVVLRSTFFAALPHCQCSVTKQLQIRLCEMLLIHKGCQCNYAEIFDSGILTDRELKRFFQNKFHEDLL